MAELTTQQRAEVRAILMQRWSDARETVAVTKPDLLAAVNALDTFMNDNATSINTAIPQPARSNLTTQQKALLLAYVVLKRYEVI